MESFFGKESMQRSYMGKTFAVAASSNEESLTEQYFLKPNSFLLAGACSTGTIMWSSM